MKTAQLEFLLAVILCGLCLGLSSQISKSTVARNEDYGWKIGNVYKYDISVCVSSTNIFGTNDNSVGRLWKADLYIEPLFKGEWSAKFNNFRAKSFMDEVEPVRCEYLRSSEHNFTKYSSRVKSFKINSKDGVSTVNPCINDDKIVNVEEGSDFNFFTPLLQLDLEGPSCHLPTEGKPNVVCKTMEPFLGRCEECETQYRVSPLLIIGPEVTSPTLPSLRGNELFFEVKRTTDYEKCLQRFNATTRRPDVDKIISSEFTDRAVIMGNRNSHIIKSSFSTFRHTAMGEDAVLVRNFFISYLNLTSIYTANGQPFPRVG